MLSKKRGRGFVHLVLHIYKHICPHINEYTWRTNICSLYFHIYNRIKRNNICPPRPHIDQYIWARIFLFIYWKTYLEKKHLFTLFLPLLATFLQWWKARLIAGRQSKRSPTLRTWLSWSWSSCSPMTIIIIFTHDHAGYRQAVEEIADLENINITIGMVRIMFIIITITTIISKSESKYLKPSRTPFHTFSTSRTPWNIFF